MQAFADEMGPKDKKPTRHQTLDQKWIKYHKQKEYLRFEGSDASPQPWQTEPELPAAQELLSTFPPSLPLNDISGPPPSKMAYLETQYRLCRFEGTELLRRAIAKFKRAPQAPETENGDFHVYTQVHVSGYCLSKLGPACRVTFSTERAASTVAWRQSTRLTTGSLIALSPKDDGFRTKCLVATVAARPVKGGLEPDFEAGESPDTPPRVDIFWATPEDAIIDPAIELVMVEASGGYFEQIRHSLVGLQHAARYEYVEMWREDLKNCLQSRILTHLCRSKFDKYVIGADKSSRSAEYLLPGDDGVEPAVFQPMSTDKFDTSQQEAFECMTTKELAIVQGPPGTGKTFTSVVALESLVRTLTTPIVVAAQTNHALDQILSACTAAFNPSYVRLGGRSEDDEVGENSLYNLRRKHDCNPRSRTVERARQKIQDCLTPCFPTGSIIPAKAFLDAKVISPEQYESLLETVDDESIMDMDPMELWLDHNIEVDMTVRYTPPAPNRKPIEVAEDPATNLREKTAENDAKERLHGVFVSTDFYATVTGSKTGSTYKRAQKWLRASDLYDIKPPRRGDVYRYLRQELLDKSAEEFRDQLYFYAKACTNLAEERWIASAQAMARGRIRIIGCTTTGLTKYRGLIAAMKPKAMLIEEAAETREANITSAIYPDLDQLILVGDHQQLVPHVDVHELCSLDYNFNTSLFERLVGLDLPFSMLSVQRRMIPAIREIVSVFYKKKKLTDHEIVNDPNERPPVPGMKDINHFWYMHRFKEHQTADMSRANLDEARMIVGFAKYLMQNGMLPSQITVLSYYSAQLKLIEQLFGSEKRHCSVRTVDGFQGEQNEVIILSLVRSCADHEAMHPGFVTNENRAVVALSRAKCGLYVFGNANTIQNNDAGLETWSKVMTVFDRHDKMGMEMPVWCDKHQTTTLIRSVNQWEDEVPDGGCQQPCEFVCDRDHRCPLKCHPIGHDAMPCQVKCDKTLSCGHDCAYLCGEICVCSHPKCSKDTKPQKASTQVHAHSSSHANHGELAEKYWGFNPRTNAYGNPWDVRHVHDNDKALDDRTRQANSQRALPRIVETFRPTATTTTGHRVRRQHGTQRSASQQGLHERSQRNTQPSAVPQQGDMQTILPLQELPPQVVQESQTPIDEPLIDFSDTETIEPKKSSDMLLIDFGDEKPPENDVPKDSSFTMDSIGEQLSLLDEPIPMATSSSEQLRVLSSNLK